MKIRLKFLIALIWIVATALSHAEQDVTKAGWILGKPYRTVVKIETLEKTPKWSNLSDPVPVSLETAARKALFYANSRWNFRSAREPKSEQWELKSASLERVGRRNDWIYSVEIQQRGPIQGLRLPMIIVILLDGNVVPPEESPELQIEK
jgi:hypothetical protein